MGNEAQHFINVLTPYINHYGYWVAFFGMMLENAGIPVPGETALIVVAFYAGRGLLNIWIAIPLVILGDVIGDSIGYLIGRFGGRPLVEKYGQYVRIDEKKLIATETLFREKGLQTVFASQFSSLTRTTGSIAAGLAHMPFRKFITVDTAAASLLVTMVATLTFRFSQNLDLVLHFLKVFRTIGLVAVALIIVTYLYRHYKRSDAERRKWLIRKSALAVLIAIALSAAYYLLVRLF